MEAIHKKIIKSLNLTRIWGNPSFGPIYIGIMMAFLFALELVRRSGTWSSCNPREKREEIHTTHAWSSWSIWVDLCREREQRIKKITGSFQRVWDERERCREDLGHGWGVAWWCLLWFQPRACAGPLCIGSSRRAWNFLIPSSLAPLASAILPLLSLSSRFLPVSWSFTPSLPLSPSVQKSWSWAVSDVILRGSDGLANALSGLIIVESWSWAAFSVALPRACKMVTTFRCIIQFYF